MDDTTWGLLSADLREEIRAIMSKPIEQCRRENEQEQQRRPLPPVTRGGVENWPVGFVPVGW